MSYISAYCHFVFRTKSSKPSLNPLHSDKLFKYINGICAKKGSTLVRVNCMPDHVHLAVWLSPGISISNFMQEIKRGSSYWLSNNRELFPLFDGWAKGYSCSTFSARAISKVKSYIANQQKHHLSATLHDEMVGFFKSAGITEKLDFFFKD